MESGSLLVSAAAGVAIFAGSIHLLRRVLRQRRDAAALREKIERNQHHPRSLHPVMDPDICIGSLSCLKACPEGDILGIVDGAARLVHADHCIGHGRCAAECPVGAIRLVFGTAERGVDLPEVDEFFESSRAGVHVVGELGGMGLIKNAITQGLQAAERLGDLLRGSDGGRRGRRRRPGRPRDGARAQGARRALPAPRAGRPSAARWRTTRAGRWS